MRTISYLLSLCLAAACQPKNLPSTKTTEVASQPSTTASQPAKPQTSAAPRWVWENPRPSGQQTLAIWASSLSEGYAVGENGSIWRLQGSEAKVLESPTQKNLRGVWAKDKLVIAVGDDGTLLRSTNGTTFEVETLPVASTFSAVWGSSASDLFVIGAAGKILHFDGKTWTEQKSNTEVALTAITGRGPRDVYAVGEQGVILRYDGEQWTEAQSPSQEDWLSVVIAGAAVYVGGSKGGLVRTDDGFLFASQPSEAKGPLRVLLPQGRGLLAMGPQDTVAFDGKAWKHTPFAGEFFLAGLAIEKGVLLVSSQGRIFRREGEAVQEITRGPRAQINDIALGAGGTGFVTSESGLYYYEDGFWSLATSTKGAWLEAVSGTGEGAIAVGPAGLILRRSSEGFWESEANGTQAWLTDVTVKGREAYAVGQKGVVLSRSEEGQWQELPAPTSYSLFAVTRQGSDLFMAGEGGTILRYHDKTFSVEKVPVTQDLKALCTVGDQLWAVGNKGTILVREADVWRRETSPSEANLFALYCPSTEELYAVGASGTLLQRRDGTWKAIEVPTSLPLLGVGGSSRGIVVVGAGGVILRVSGL